jgi:hypothetical protein
MSTGATATSLERSRTSTAHPTEMKRRQPIAAALTSTRLATPMGFTASEPTPTHHAGMDCRQLGWALSCGEPSRPASISQPVEATEIRDVVA